MAAHNLRSRQVSDSQVPDLPNSSSNSTLPQRTLEERLAAAEAENRRLHREQRLRQLERENEEMRNPDPHTPQASSYSPAPSERIREIEEDIVELPTSKEMRPEKMSPTYKGVSSGEHTRWFREVDVRINLSPSYFRTDKSMILYCMQSLEGDAATQWHSVFQQDKSLTGVTFAYFRNFLLDLVADPLNRRLLAYERLDEARQKPDQKVTLFKSYLEELESHVEPVPEEHRANSFLAKLRPDLKALVIGTGRVPKTREEILALAILQEGNLERSKGGKSSSLGRSPDDRVSKSGSSGNKSQSSRHQRKIENRRQQQQPSKQSSEANPDHKNDTCYHCGKKGHRKPECPHKDDPNWVVPVNAVTAKKAKLRLRPQSRSKKNGN